MPKRTTELDLTKLTQKELSELVFKANTQIKLKEKQKTDKEKNELLSGTEVKELMGKFKTLSNEFESFKNIDVDLEIKFKLMIKFDNIDFDDIISDAVYGNLPDEDVIFSYDVDVEVGENNLDRVQLPVLKEAIKNYVSNEEICQEVFNMFPKHRKQIRDFQDNLLEAAEEIETFTTENHLEYEELQKVKV